MADIIPREFIELLLERVDIVDFINLQIPLRKKSGSNYFARCPFHQEKSASFSVSQPKQFYYCFGCGAHGNAIDFLMQNDHMSFPEAVEALARHAGMEVPRTASHIKKDDSIPALHDLAKDVAVFYYEHMRNAPRAIDYLKNRGISGKIAQQFQLGYAPSGWSHVLDHFDKSDADKKKLLDTGLIIKKDGGGYYDRFRDRIMFPIHDYRGRVIGFGGRILDQGEPKYLNSPETPIFQKGHELYGLYQALKSNRELERVMIVEGYMDVIALFQHDVTYAVATLGTATSAHHLQRLFRYTSEIIFCFDGDEAGRNAAWRALQVLFTVMHDSLQIRFLFLPDGEDPDSLIRKEGKEQFETRIANGASLSEFFFQSIGKQADMNTMEGRARFAALALNHIKTLPEGIFQGMMMTELAKRARVNIDELKSQLHVKGESQPAKFNPAIEEDSLKNKLSAPMRLALALLVQQPTLAALIKEPLPTSSLTGNAFLAEMIHQIQSIGGTPNTGSLLEYYRGKKEESFIARLAHYETNTPDAAIEGAFLGCLRQIQVLTLEDDINRLMAKAAQTGLSDLEKQELNTAISRKKTF